MQVDWLSITISFVVSATTGFLAGFAAKYFADKHTDRRREQESGKKRLRDFSTIKTQMPELIAELKTDLSREGCELTREFFVLPSNKNCVGGSEIPRFFYYEDEHEDLRNKLLILETCGYLIDVTPSNAPIYRMTEEFVALVFKNS